MQTGRLLFAASAKRSVLEVAALESDFSGLYTSAFPKVYSFIRSQVRNVQIAQDLTGRVFLKAYKHRRRAPSGPASILWVFRIAHTTLIDYWRVEGRRASVSLSIDELVVPLNDESDPETAYAAKERAALLLTVMASLSHEDRSILALKFAAQRTNREIAAIVGSTEGAVSMRLLRALRRLRERLLERGITS